MIKNLYHKAGSVYNAVPWGVSLAATVGYFAYSSAAMMVPDTLPLYPGGSGASYATQFAIGFGGTAAGVAFSMARLMSTPPSEMEMEIIKWEVEELERRGEFFD